MVFVIVMLLILPLVVAAPVVENGFSPAELDEMGVNLKYSLES